MKKQRIRQHAIIILNSSFLKAQAHMYKLTFDVVRLKAIEISRRHIIPRYPFIPRLEKPCYSNHDDVWSHDLLPQTNDG